MSDVLSVKSAVRARDGFRCVECGMSNDDHNAFFGRQLDVHRVIPGSPYTVEGCVTLCRDCHGGKPKRRRGSLDYRTIRLSKEVGKKAKLVSIIKGVSISRYIEGVVAAAVEKDLPKEVASLGQSPL